ncbi:hypothetical protein GWK47_000465 [Chionoecetes opilio]|uniref:Uncharacterized protein n=1 Tax=Chionoecetes opilio TaxID=41210 RepID=A0A8J4YBE5_CHIOP|nr:hypothetical protein GWK47_000465 [Chionoecetes opilio]
MLNKVPTSARSTWSIERGPSKSMPLSTGMARMRRDVLGSDSWGPTSGLWLVLVSGPPAYPEASYWESTSDRQINRNGSGRGHPWILLEAPWVLTGVIMPCVLDTTASNSGVQSGSCHSF